MPENSQQQDVTHREYYMPGRDTFHDAVRTALEKEGWTITHDPLFIQFGGVDLFVDLGAERIIAAERNGERIAVIVKWHS